MVAQSHPLQGEEKRRCRQGKKVWGMSLGWRAGPGGDPHRSEGRRVQGLSLRLGGRDSQTQGRGPGGSEPTGLQGISQGGVTPSKSRVSKEEMPQIHQDCPQGGRICDSVIHDARGLRGAHLGSSRERPPQAWGNRGSPGGDTTNWGGGYFNRGALGERSPQIPGG